MKDSVFYKEIINKLEKLTKKEYALFSSLGIQTALIIGLLTFICFTFFEFVFHFSSAVRTILFLIFLFLAIGSLVFLFIIPALRYFNVFRRTNYLNVAGKVGKNFPIIKDDLLNAMQLVSISSGNNYYSVSLIDAAFKNVYEKSKNIQFESIINFNRSKNLFLYLIRIILIASGLTLFAPGINSAATRLVNFNTEYIAPQKFTFEVFPGNSEITKGDDILLTVKVKGAKLNNISLAIKSEDQTDYEMQNITSDSTGDFHFEKKAVRNSFKYFAEAENIKSDDFKIDVIDHPIIKNIDVKIISPSYSKIPPAVLSDNGNITALVGSTVDMKISSTKILKNTELRFSDSTKMELNIHEKIAEVKFIIRKDNDYKIILTDESGNNNLYPITYNLKALTDAYPTIEVLEPNKDVTLANDNRLPLFLKVTDDYGFTKLLLKYRLAASKYESPQKDYSSIEIPLTRNNKENDVNYIWNLSDLNLAVDDIVTYYLEIFDNDVISGPKSTKSPSFNVRVPSLDEILAKADNTQSQSEEDLKEILKQADELKNNLEKIDQDLKKDSKELTWEEKQKIEKSLDQFKDLQKKTEKVNDQMTKMQQDLQQNNLLSKETLEKYMELQNLMKELSSEEMQKLMDRMQSMLQKLDRNQMQQAMENMKLDEEKFQKSIERTLNLLKRIQIEQKVDELLKRSEQMTDKQNNLEKETNENDLSSQTEKDDLSNKQDEISKDLDKFNEELKKLEEKMKSFEDMPKDELAKMKDEFEKQENQEKSNEASQNIQENQKQKAQQNQSQVSKNMKQMSQLMKQLQESIKQQNQMQAFTDMMKMLENLISLSKQEEELKKKSENLDQTSSSFEENAQKQNDISRNLDKLLQQMSALSQKTFAITPEMGKSLGDAKKHMEQSIQSMQNRNGSMASSSQGEAMKSLNEAASLMKGSMESMMQGGGKGGMMSLMQQLGKLSQQQMQLNNLTQQLQQGMQNQGQMSMQQQAQLQKLAQQQELIRKSIDQLNQEAKQSGTSKGMAANLNEVLSKMQEVVTDMQTEKLDDQLVQKQERILSKLLDAQRSVNERDFEKRRESNSGKNFVRQSPGELNLSSQKEKDKIRDELNRAINEGYTRDYEQLIRKYYEALQKENSVNQ